jgi:hypothetical protein
VADKRPLFNKETNYLRRPNICISEFACKGKGKGKGKVHSCTSTEALYRPYDP